MKKSSFKKGLKFIGIIFFLILMIKVYYELKLIDLIMGIYNIEVKRKKIALISNKSLMFIAKKNDAENLLVEEMKKFGWEYVNQFGNGYIFSNSDEEILLKKKNYLIGYTVFEICTADNIETGHNFV